jgi:sugar phosphate isomerase/epimerase
VDQLADRAWSYVTLGRGHDASWWRGFSQSLRKVGYDGVLSIEHEDQSLSSLEGVRESVKLLREVLR